MTNPIKDRVGYTLNGFTVTRLAYTANHAFWYAVHACGTPVPSPRRFERFKHSVCAVCKNKAVQDKRDKPTPQKKTEIREAYRKEADIKERKRERAVDRVYRFFVSMPTHELNNRWNDA